MSPALMERQVPAESWPRSYGGVESAGVYGISRGLGHVRVWICLACGVRIPVGSCAFVCLWDARWGIWGAGQGGGQSDLRPPLPSHPQRSSDESLSHEEDLGRVLELQDLLDRQSREQTQMKERLATLSSRVAELEEDLDTARKDLIKSEEANSRLQRDVREVRGGCLALPVLVQGCGSSNPCLLRHGALQHEPGTLEPSGTPC